MSVSPDVVAQLAALREQYVESLWEKLAQIEESWCRWRDDAALSWGEALHRGVHGLAGAGTTYGLPGLSDAAREVETFVSNIMAQQRGPDHSDRLVIESMLRRLMRVATDDVTRARALSKFPFESPPPARPSIAPDRQQVAVVSKDPGADLLSQLASLSHVRFDDCAALEAALGDGVPGVVVVDEPFWANDDDNAREFRALRHALPATVPVVCIASNSDFATRLRAIRLEAHFVERPFTPTRLEDLLAELMSTEDLPCRVLFVDDDATTLKLYAALFTDAGMTVQTVSDPLQALNAVHEFRPEVIVLDAHMPTISGVELCKMFRQHEDLLATPVLFLSAETRWDLQRLAMDAGADDFLVKPVDFEHIAATVRARVQRLRRINAFALRDGLTGLFNRAMFMERLRSECARTRRHGGELSLAVIDVDHFKLVNDTHGHPVGDRVLRSVARSLKDNVREGDTVARCGGEEFAIILPGADASSAAAVVDEIRAGFASTLHTSSFGDFRVTLSAGVASFDASPDAEAMSEAADQALYSAKHSGRNRVIVHRPSSGFHTRPSAYRRASSMSFRAVRAATDKR